MGIITYALVTYGITAVISLLTIAVILAVNGIMSRSDRKNSQE